MPSLPRGWLRRGSGFTAMRMDSRLRENDGVGGENNGCAEHEALQAINFKLKNNQGNHHNPVNQGQKTIKAIVSDNQVNPTSLKATWDFVKVKKDPRARMVGGRLGVRLGGGWR